MRPKEPRVGDKCGRQVWETSVNSCGPRHPEWETRGDKGETSVNPCGPRNPEWQTSVGDRCGDKWATSGRHVGDKCKLMRPNAPKSGRQGGDKCKLMWPKAPRVGDKCGRQVETHAAQGTQSGRQVWETSVR